MVAAVAAPAISVALSAPDPRAGLRSAATFLQVLEQEMLHEAVPASLPSPAQPPPPPASMLPEYLWMPVPVVRLPAREDRTAKKRPPARKDRPPARR